MADKGISAFAKRAYDLLTKKSEVQTPVPIQREPRAAEVMSPRVLEVTKTHPDYQVVQGNRETVGGLSAGADGVGVMDANQNGPRTAPEKDIDEGRLSGPRAYQRDAYRPAARSLLPSGGYPRAERPEDVQQRFDEHLKKAQANPHPLVQEVRMPNNLEGSIETGVDKLVGPLRESRGLRLAADKIANKAGWLKYGAVTKSMDAMDTPYGRAADKLYTAVDGPDAAPRRVIARAVDKLSPPGETVEVDEAPTQLPEVTVEGDEDLRKKK